MNCPHCQKELPDNYRARWCTFCGKDLPASGTYITEQTSAATLPPFKINWLIFFGALLVPPLLTMLTASTVGGRNEQVSPTIAFCGGGVGGIICGVLLGLRIGRTVPARFALGILLSFVMAIVCVMLCLLGCTIGGYQMRFN
jgi:hypothetical protein